MDLSLIKNIVLEIPLIQIGILALICTVIALLGRFKFLLVCVYGFILYWVFILNETKFSFSQGAELLHTALFIIVSIIFVGVSAWILFFEK